MDDPIPPYSSYTYAHPSWFVRYPHLKRNRLVAAKIIESRSKAWLDYGAGDGALLSELIKMNALPTVTVCYEPDSHMHLQLAQNVSKLEKHSSSIKLTRSISDTEGVFDLVTALEVLEHLPLPERIRFYGFLARNTTNDGTVLLEVPVEYGPILLVKELGRKFLKGRISEYSFRELLEAAFGGAIFDAHSRYLSADNRMFISPHRGFDLDRLLNELRSIGIVEEVLRSPFSFLPRWLNQTILFSFQLKVRDISEIGVAVLKADRK